VNGLNLKEMEASDMLDVLHYFIEEDMNYSSAEHAEGRSRTREILYQDFYGQNYKYATSRNGSQYASASGSISKDFDSPYENEEETLVPFDPLKGPTKSFVPATPVNAAMSRPFGAAIEEPLTK
jgi:hypothetical protein